MKRQSVGGWPPKHPNVLVMAMDNVKWGPFKTELRTSAFMVLVICELWMLGLALRVDATTPHRVLNAFLNGLQIVLLWFSLRILQIRLKMNLNNCWCLLQPSSYIWIGKNYVIFFSIQIIVSLWCILLFCLLRDCEILHRNRVFSDRIEIEKTEVFWSHTGAKTIGPDILEIQILNIFRKSKYFVITFMFLLCLIQIELMDKKLILAPVWYLNLR